MKLKNPENKNIIIFISAIAVIIALLTVVLIAGYIDIKKEYQEYQASSVKIPNDLHEGIHEFHSDLNNLEIAISADVHYLGEKLGTAEKHEDLQKLLYEYYADNPWIQSLIYYDNDRKEFTEIPIILNSQIFNKIPFPNEEEMKSAVDGAITKSCVFIPENGYLNLYFKAVYDKDWNYLGYVMVATEYYNMLNIHPLMVNQDRAYDDYICFIVSKSGDIIYSSIQETIGDTITDKKPFYNGQCLLLAENKETGAYKYESRAFYNYLGENTSEKVTAWHQIYKGDYSYNIYMVKELNQPKLVYDNVYKLTTEQTLKDVEDLFKFSVLNALSDTFERVNSGYYNSYIYILDMDGKIVSSSENNTIGVNYLNSRGAYGYSYISSMIYSAQQGGGYVYYMYPVDGSFRAEASQYSLGYIMPINNDYFIFGRFSGDEDAQPIDYSIRSDSSSVAREIINQVSLKGIDSIIYEINSDPENAQEKFVPNLTTNVEDIAVIDMHGNLYASVYNPTLVGESLTSHTDVYGTSIIRKLIMHAKNGGGFMSDLTQSKDREGYVDLWLICVEPVDNNYFITTAAIIGTYEDVLTPYLKK